MKFFKNMIRWALLPVIMMSALIVFTACGGGSPKPKTKTYNINFIVDDEIYETIKTSGKDEITLPENPEKEEYVFDGWFYDLDVWEEPFLANSLIEKNLTSDLNVYAKWKEIVLDRIEYSDKRNISVHDTFDAKLFDAVCKDKDGVILPIPVSVTPRKELIAGQELIVDLNASYKDKQVSKSITIKVYDDPILECDESKDFIVYPKFDEADWFEAKATDSFNANLLVNFNYDKELKPGEVVNLTIKVEDAAGNSVSKTIENIKVCEYVEIRTAEDLKNVDYRVDYKLMNDIDLRGAQWVPLTQENAYKGVFDGGNHIIKNFNIREPYACAGLFAKNIGVIKNLKVQNFTIKFTCNENTSSYIGGLVGNSISGVVSNCSAESGYIGIDFNQLANSKVCIGGLIGSASYEVDNCQAQEISISTTNEDVSVTRLNVCAGGLLGQAENVSITDCNCSSNLNIQAYIALVGGFLGELSGSFAEVVNCYSTGKVVCNAENSAMTNIGGFSGSVTSATILNCYSSGAVEATTSGNNVGGFSGYASNSYFEKCYSTGELHFTGGDEKVGGFIGYTYNCTIFRCYRTSDTLAEGSLVGPIYCGGFIGYDNKGSIKDCYVERSRVTTSSKSDAYSGGIIGQSNHSNVKCCYTTAFSINSVSSNVYAYAYSGGLTAHTSNSAFEDCFSSCMYIMASATNSNSTSAKVIAADLRAFNALSPNMSTFLRCYVDRKTEITATRAGKGEAKTEKTAERRSEGVLKYSAYVNGDLEFDTNFWDICNIDEEYFPKLKEVRGYEPYNDTVFEVSSLGDILDIRNLETKNGKYVLTNDIDLEGYTFPSCMFGSFDGEIDGKGYTIKNFKVGSLNNPNTWSSQGLIAANHGVIKNLNFSDFEICARCSVFVGDNFGIIENCNISAYVYWKGNNIYAGFVKKNNCGTIRNCSIKIDQYSPTFEGGIFGGFAAINNKGTIENCYCYYNSSTTIYLKSIICGGFVAINSGKILNCYTNWNMRVSITGRIVGRQEEDYVYYYSFGNIFKIGGFVSFNYGEIENCFVVNDISITGLQYETYRENSPAPKIIVSTQIGIGSFAYVDCGTITNCYIKQNQEANMHINYSFANRQFEDLDMDISGLLNNYNCNFSCAELENFTNEKFVTENLNWDASVWNFVEGELPTLKNNQLS